MLAPITSFCMEEITEKANCLLFIYTSPSCYLSYSPFCKSSIENAPLFQFPSHKKNTNGNQNYADELRSRKYPYAPPDLVPTKQFQCEPDHRIIKHINAKKLSSPNVLFPKQIHHDSEKNKIQSSLHQLNRHPRHVIQSGDQLIFRKLHTAKTMILPAIAAACKKTADSSHPMNKWNQGSKDIHKRSKFHIIPTAVPVHSGHSTDESAIINIPAKKVIYKIEDTYLGSEEVRYGEKLDKLNFPQIPAKEGFYGAWPDVSEQRMGGTFVVEAAYKDNVTVVQSSGDAAGTDEGTWKRPYALVEDLFTEDTSLTASICDKTPPEEADGRQHVVYKVTLENGGIGETDSFALRLLNPYEKAVVYGCTGEAWTELESKSRGQYLQVDMTGTQEYFCIMEETTNKLLIIGGSAAAAAGLLMLAALRKRSARRKQPRAQKEKNEIKRK